MSVSERLKKYCKENKITSRELISKGFGSSQTINNYMNGNTEPKASFLEQFIKEYKVSAAWLMTGKESDNQINLIDPGQKDLLCQNCIEIKQILEAQYKTIQVLEKYIKAIEDRNELERKHTKSD